MVSSADMKRLPKDHVAYERSRVAFIQFLVMAVSGRPKPEICPLPGRLKWALLPKSATAIPSVAVDRSPNFPIERRILHNAFKPETCKMFSCSCSFFANGHRMYALVHHRWYFCAFTCFDNSNIFALTSGWNRTVFFQHCAYMLPINKIYR